MSGEAGATLRGEGWSLFLGRGLIEDVAIPPGAGGDYVGAYFDRESAPFRRWLERARPGLEALFAEAGVAASAAPVHLHGDRVRMDYRSFNLAVHLARTLPQAELDALVDRAVTVVLAVEAEPPPPDDPLDSPPDSPSPPRSPLGRLRRWLGLGLLAAA
jgi:hypothetical protein